MSLCLISSPVTAQQAPTIAELRATLEKQQLMIDQLLRRLSVLEKGEVATVVPAAEDVRADIKAHADAVDSLRETVTRRVNLNGYYNFRFSADGSETPLAFQQHHLGIILGKQLGRFNVLTELELQNVPHHAQVESPERGEDDHSSAETDTSGEGQVAVENAWMEYSHNRYIGVRVGKQLSPQYWWQHRYPNLTYSTALPIHLRELFPAELIGVMFQGSASRSVGNSELGVGYKLYVANNDFEGNSQADLRDGKSWGARVQVQLPARGRIRRLDVAADVYRGRVGVGEGQLAEDHVVGLEAQLEIARISFNSEFARGTSLGLTRSGYYVQSAVRLAPDWLAFYRAEQLVSERVHSAEQRHIGGVNYRPYPQIAIKGEVYRAVPLTRKFIRADEGRQPFNGVATAAVFFF